MLISSYYSSDVLFHPLQENFLKTFHRHAHMMGGGCRCQLKFLPPPAKPLSLFLLLFHLVHPILNRLIKVLNFPLISAVHILRAEHKISRGKIVRNRNVIDYRDT